MPGLSDKRLIIEPTVLNVVFKENHGGLPRRTDERRLPSSLDRVSFRVSLRQKKQKAVANSRKATKSRHPVNCQNLKELAASSRNRQTDENGLQGPPASQPISALSDLLPASVFSESLPLSRHHSIRGLQLLLAALDRLLYFSTFLIRPATRMMRAAS